MRNKRHNQNHEINAGSMADVAFLLLIFFLVTTSVSQIGHLPSPVTQDSSANALKTPASATIIFYINDHNAVMAEQSILPMDKIPGMVENLLLLHKNRKTFVGINYTPASDFNTFVDVRSAICKGVENARNSMSLQDYGIPHNRLQPEEQRKITRKIHLGLYEAETKL